ncbi:hypothetical protein [Amycolatopsis cihanbeyliensis]|nr:hypothetical protein [Amycolatopsis cihanbeyliensis]
MSLAQGLLDGGRLASHVDPPGGTSPSEPGEPAEWLVDLFVHGVRA